MKLLLSLIRLKHRDIEDSGSIPRKKAFNLSLYCLKLKNKTMPAGFTGFAVEPKSELIQLYLNW